MILRRIGADNHYAVSISDINPVIGHGSSAKAFRQTGDSGGVSYAGAVFQIHHAESTVHLLQQVALFII